MESNSNFKYTFYQHRSCLHCGKQIADQIHSRRLYCERFVLPNGDIQSCHDDFHTKKNKQKNMQYNSIINMQRKQHRNIEKLFKTQGEIVTSEELDSYNIRLDSPVKTRKIGSVIKYYFVDYLIIQLSEQKFKIEKHGRKF